MTGVGSGWDWNKSSEQMGLGGEGGPSAFATPPNGTIELDNTYSGEGTYAVSVFADADGNEVPVIAISKPDSEFPSVVIMSNGTLYFGDGSVDPFNSDEVSTIEFDGSMTFRSPDFQFYGDSFAIYNTDLELWSGHGVVLRSPNNTKYRLKVANDGTLSTEAA